MMTIAGLGGTLGNFAADLREMFQARAEPEPGSPAAREEDGERFAAEWARTRPEQELTRQHT